MAVRRENVISVTQRQVYYVDLLNKTATYQSNSYPIFLTRLGGPRSRPNPHFYRVILQIMFGLPKALDVIGFLL